MGDKECRIVNIDTYDERVIVLLNNATMFIGRGKYDTNKQTLKLHLDQTNLHFHSGPIVGMDVCTRKPLIATASKDKTIKIWNYEEKTVETPKAEA